MSQLPLPNNSLQRLWTCKYNSIEKDKYSYKHKNQHKFLFLHWYSYNYLLEFCKNSVHYDKITVNLHVT